MKKDPRLDPRVIRTRQLLRDALMALIPEMGYDLITVQHITDRATLNRATFYLHYHDKQDLLTQIIDQVVSDLSAVPPIQPSSPPDMAGVRAVFIHLFDHVARHADFYRIMLREPSVAPYLYQIQDHFQATGMRLMTNSDGVDRELLTPPDLFVAFIGWAYLGVIHWWVVNGMPGSSEYMAIQFMRLALGGIQHEFHLPDLITSLESELRISKP